MKTMIVAAALVLSLLTPLVATAQTTGAPSAGPFTISAEALLWWLKDSPAPVPLVTDGVIGAPGTRVFLGGEDVDANPLPGFRVGAGYAFSDRWGVEGSVFYLPTRSSSRSVSSSGQPGSVDLKIPFFNPLLPGEDFTSLSRSTTNEFGGPFAGFATERLSTSFLGAELNGTMKLASTGQWRVDAIGGLRYLRLRETYTFETSSPFIPPAPADIFQTSDEFDATNHFIGPQVGIRARGDWGPIFVSGVVKVGFGAMRQHVDVAGSLTTNDFNDFGPPQTFAGGYFAQPTNIGRHRRTVFGVVPEAALKVGWRLTPALSLVAGYTFLYVNDVARPGNQIDRAINPNVPAINFEPTAPPAGPARPTFKFNGSDFWAHGINIGLAFHF